MTQGPARAGMEFTLGASRLILIEELPFAMCFLACEQCMEVSKSGECGDAAGPPYTWEPDVRRWGNGPEPLARHWTVR